MRLLKDGREVADPFVTVADDAPLPDAPVIVSLKRFLASKDALLAQPFALGVALTVPAEQALGCVDPGPIVIDEVMGMMITLALVPVGWGGMLLGFLLFRALDVFKPFPARQLEHLHGGFGVMCDDAMAAVYANLLLRGAYYLAPGWIA